MLINVKKLMVYAVVFLVMSFAVSHAVIVNVTVSGACNNQNAVFCSLVEESDMIIFKQLVCKDSSWTDTNKCYNNRNSCNENLKSNIVDCATKNTGKLQVALVSSISDSRKKACESVCQQRVGRDSNGIKVFRQSICQKYTPSSSDYGSDGRSLWEGYEIDNGKRICEGDGEKCWCETTRSNSNSGLSDEITILAAAGLIAGSGSVPGTNPTDATWKDPSEIENPPKKAPNQYLCNMTSDIKITGNIPALVEANTQVELNGKVEKFSQICEGLSYQCRPWTKVGCEVKDSLLKKSLKALPCPSNYPQALKTWGEKSGFNFGALILIATVAGSFGGSVVGKAQAAKLEKLRNGLIVLGALTNNQMNQQACGRICGRTYWTDEKVVCTAQPTCNGPVINSKGCNYKCSKFSCGGFEGKTINVQIKNNEGVVVDTKNVITDAKGEFRLNFKTPDTEGSYAVVAEVVKNWQNVMINDTSAGGNVV